MRAAVDFGTILDEKLEAPPFSWPSPAGRPAQAAWRPGPRPVFLFGDIHNGFSASPRPTFSSSAPAWTPVYGARPGAQPRPARRLSAGQREALNSLRALGAVSLADDFSAADIKSAFRALARRYHPDRHPGLSDAERASLARSFAAACDAYRALTASVH